MKTYHLDPDKFPRVRRNIIITYIVLAIIGFVVFYLYIREALFGQAWMLIPFVLFVFALAGWFALRERKKYWDGFQLTIQDNALIRLAPKMLEMKVKRAGITGVREVRQGLIVSTKVHENTLLIPKDLRDEDYQTAKRILEKWTANKG